jgi:hypothetical protein
MSVTPEKREAVRIAGQYCCGYCGVSENSVGNELDIDHYQPIKSGGTDDLSNLIYVCPGCNRFKADYWPQEDDPDSFNLLHPHADDLSAHISLATNGRLVGITPRGWFHIQWLHLNRPQLIVYRQRLQYESELQEILTQTEAGQFQLQERIRFLEQEVAALQQLIARLMNSPE